MTTQETNIQVVTAVQSLTALVPSNQLKMFEVVLSPQQHASIAEIVDKKKLADMTAAEYTLFGSARQKALGSTLDAMLTQINANDSPEVFRLFQELKKGVENLNMGELQLKIQESLKHKWYHRFLDALGLSSLAKRLAAAGDQIAMLVTEKTKSLGDLLARMEVELDTSATKLIEELSRIAILAGEHRKNIMEFAVVASAGYAILDLARRHEAQLITEAQATQDPLKIQDVRNFQRKLQAFENRVVVLHQAYTKAPIELETMGMLEGATVQTLSETAASSLEEFNDIKSALLKLVVLYRIKSVQQLNTERRTLRAVLQKYNIHLLEDVAVSSANAMGDNRVEDAMLLLSFAQGVASIGEKMNAAHAANRGKFDKARSVLTDAQVLMKEIEGSGNVAAETKALDQY